MWWMICIFFNISDTLGNERATNCNYNDVSRSSRLVELNFNRKHGMCVAHDSVAKLIWKFQKTGTPENMYQSVYLKQHLLESTL